MIDRAALQAAIPHCLTETSLRFGTKYVGKVRDTYDVDDDRVLLITTDRQSGFDRMLGAVPFKGQVLNRTSLYWFAQTAGIVRNHVIGSPHANALLAHKCAVLPIEFVVRGYLTGSTDTAIWTQYSKGSRTFGGCMLRDGMVKNEPLPSLLLTPTTKESSHDRPISPEDIVREGWLTQAQWDFCAEKALTLFAFGQRESAMRGLMLVDTKYEFGVAADGQIVLIDEVHTPDSSRYWLADSYAERMAKGVEPEMIDKEFFRLWFRERCDPYADAVLPTPPDELIAELSSRYIALYERITGLTFVPDERPLEAAIADALAAGSNE